MGLRFFKSVNIYQDKTQALNMNIHSLNFNIDEYLLLN